MRLVVLISCMHEKDYSIVERTNVQTDAVVVNQCDDNSIEDYTFVNKKGETCHAFFIKTTERGLSRSRNMALRNAFGDLCLICDDDEELADDYEDIIVGAFDSTPQADLIAFNVNRPRRKPFVSQSKLGYFQALKVSSVHITFRRERVVDNNIMFDTQLGSGSGNGGGEDTRFMRDCYENRLSIWCNPAYISSLKDTGESLWFKGYDKLFFENSGWVSRRVFGGFFSIIKLLHFAIAHWQDYRGEISFWDAVLCSYKGWKEKR